MDFLRAWDAHPELRRGRTSLPNYNFLMAAFLLLISPEAYDTYAMWFPQVTPSKKAKLQLTFDAYCAVIPWPRYQAEYDQQGKLHRRQQCVLGLPAKDNPR